MLNLQSKGIHFLEVMCDKLPLDPVMGINNME